METYEQILNDTKDKQGWKWLKEQFLNSLIWFLPHPKFYKKKQELYTLKGFTRGNLNGKAVKKIKLWKNDIKDKMWLVQLLDPKTGKPLADEETFLVRQEK